MVARNMREQTKKVVLKERAPQSSGPQRLTTKAALHRELQCVSSHAVLHGFVRCLCLYQWSLNLLLPCLDVLVLAHVEEADNKGYSIKKGCLEATLSCVHLLVIWNSHHLRTSEVHVAKPKQHRGTQCGSD